MSQNEPRETVKLVRALYDCAVQLGLVVGLDPHATRQEKMADEAMQAVLNAFTTRDDEILRLRAENGALREDAARLDAVSDLLLLGYGDGPDFGTVQIYRDGRGVTLYSVYQDGKWIYTATLRAAIDAARKGEEG